MSRFIVHTKINPTSCLFGSRFVKNLFFLLAGALLFVEKIRKRAALIFLVWIAACWNSSNILLTGHNPQNNRWLSGIYGARFGCKDRGLCPYKPSSRRIFRWTAWEKTSDARPRTTLWALIQGCGSGSMWSYGSVLWVDKFAVQVNSKFPKN